MGYHELMDELNIIVTSGMKLNLDYSIDDIIDDGVQDEIYDFFMKSENDSPDEAYKILKEDDEELTYEEVQLIRLKFLSEMAN